MSPLEAVARALCALYYRRGVMFLSDMSGRMTADAYVDEKWRDFIEQARAALVALRDAGMTEGMVYAARAEADTDSYGEIFRAMLDAALEED